MADKSKYSWELEEGTPEYYEAIRREAAAINRHPANYVRMEVSKRKALLSDTSRSKTNNLSPQEIRAHAAMLAFGTKPVDEKPEAGTAMDHNEDQRRPETIKEKSGDPWWKAFSSDDLVVFLLCESFAVPINIAAGEAFVNGTGKEWFGWSIGVPLGLLGFTFHLWKRLLPASWLSSLLVFVRYATGPVFILGMIATFIYVAGPDIYRRATTNQQTDYDALKTQLDSITQQRNQLTQQLREIQSQLDDTKHQLEMARQAVHTPPAPPPPEDQIPIRWDTDFQLLWGGGAQGAQMNAFRFHGESTALAHIKDAYILSNLTGRKQQLEVFTPFNGEHIPIDQIEPIPSGATVWLIAEWKPPLSLADFLNQWGSFQVHIIYDDRQYVRSFDQEYMNEKMTREMSGAFGPRVTKKNTDK